MSLGCVDFNVPYIYDDIPAACSTCQGIMNMIAIVAGCIATPGQFYRDHETGSLFEVTHVMQQMMRVIDVKAGEPRMLNRIRFERECVQVST